MAEDKGASWCRLRAIPKLLKHEQGVSVLEGV